MAVKLIASDLDGTLLLNGAQDLREDTCDIIAQVLDAGYYFVASSGREYSNLQRLFAPVKDRILYICQNGCVAFANGEMIVRKTMDDTLAHEIINDGLSRPHCRTLVSGKDTCYCEEKETAYYDHLVNVVHNRTTKVKDLHNIGEPYSKISVYEPDGIVDLEHWQKTYQGRAEVAVGGGNWIDMQPLGVNKAEAFLEMLKRLDIAPEETIVFGDNDNDIEILKTAGIRATVASAKQEIRDMCTVITPTVEEALMKILKGEEL